VKNTTDSYRFEKGLIVVQDESGREIATLLLPTDATPITVGERLKKIGGHFYFEPTFGRVTAELKRGQIDNVVWMGASDFAAWLTGYLKFFGSRRQRVADRTAYFNDSSVQLLPTGTRPNNIVYTYVLRPKASRTKPGVHVTMEVFAQRQDGRVKSVFDGNLHAFVPMKVQGRGYDWLELGR
jgi:hypothetical protein